MATRKKTPAKPLVSASAKAEGSTPIVLPKALKDREPKNKKLEGRPAEAVSVGAQATQRPTRAAGPAGKRKMRGREAGDLSPLFGRSEAARGPKGGEAFERWLASSGIDSREQRTQVQWQELLDRFAARPIHGHRRQARGGNHLANRKDIR